MLRLRPYKKCDAESIIQWIPDEYTFRNWSADIYDRYPISSADINARYEDLAYSDSFFPMTAFDESGTVGHLTMNFTDATQKTVYFGVVIVDDTKRGKGYGNALIRLALEYAFDILKCDRVELDVFAHNEAAHRCYLTNGFHDVQTDTPAYLHLMGQDWQGLHMYLDRNDFEK